MASNDTPMNTAHQHAANAEDYHSKGLLVLAEEEFNKAADGYLAAIERSHDESTKRTLRMLYNKQCKAAKELQRKVEKLKEEGKDPNLPQKPERPTQSFAATQQQQSSNIHPQVPPRMNNASPRPMSDSQNTPDESFMLLGGQRSDPGDAFNQFWNIMQGMLENLSQPVAFATVPLGEPEIPSPSAIAPNNKEEKRRDQSLSSDTDSDEPIFSRLTKRIGLTRDASASGRPGRTSSKVNLNHDNDAFDDDDFLEGDYDDLSGSFFVVPSGAQPSASSLKTENATLKAELANMKARLEGMEKVIKVRKEQDLHLKDSIFMATREAQRVLGASTMLHRPGPPLDFSSLNINVPPVPVPGMNTPREAQYARRIKELEEELRLARAENEKQKLMIAKFRERWEKLKESAKKKKEAKGKLSTPIRDRIVEEPEAEEELDESNLHH